MKPSMLILGSRIRTNQTDLLSSETFQRSLVQFNQPFLMNLPLLSKKLVKASGQDRNYAIQEATDRWKASKSTIGQKRLYREGQTLHPLFPLPFFFHESQAPGIVSKPSPSLKQAASKVWVWLAENQAKSSAQYSLRLRILRLRTIHQKARISMSVSGPQTQTIRKLCSFLFRPAISFFVFFLLRGIQNRPVSIRTRNSNQN